MASKHINDLLKEEQLDGSTYYIWRQNIQCLLNANDALIAITETKKTPVESTSDKEKQQYQAWAKLNRSAQHLMLSCMLNDLVE